MASTLELENFEIEWLYVKNLSVIWADSQRPYIDKWAQKIADDFDPDRFDPILVTKPNGVGVYHIIDGQHRTSAIKKKYGDGERIPCRVMTEADPVKAAHIFRWLQKGRKPVGPIDDYRVAVVAKNEPEILIDKIVRSAGYKVGATKQPKTISAVRALINVYRNTPDFLRKVLDVIQLTWGAEDSSAVAGCIIEGYGLFMAEFGPYATSQRLADNVAKKFTPARLIGAAKGRREQEGGSLADHISTLLRIVYNKGLPDNKKLKAKGSK